MKNDFVIHLLQVRLKKIWNHDQSKQNMLLVIVDVHITNHVLKILIIMIHKICLVQFVKTNVVNLQQLRKEKIKFASLKNENCKL